MEQDYLKIKKALSVNGRELGYYSLRELQKQGYDIESLPFCIRILVENAVRNYDDFIITKDHIDTILNWKPEKTEAGVPFMPARVLMQDFTGVPAIVDIASLRSEMARKGKDPENINPQIPVDLVVDHSVQVDYFGHPDAYELNVKREYERNRERYRLLKWAQQAFDNFSVVPPGMGICHQVNLEYLSQCVIERDGMAFPDSLVGTDSHTPMVNGLGILAYGVGGIEAEAAVLGQPQFFSMPEVVGLKLTGRMPAGSTATDLVLTITELLRKTNVVGKFVEVFGEGTASLSVPDRATIGNMSPEFGCTITHFPVDDKTLEYLKKTNRPDDVIRLTEAYTKENLMWHANEDAIRYSKVVELDLSTVLPTLSGPSRPQDKVLLKDAKEKISGILESSYRRTYVSVDKRAINRWSDEGGNVEKPEVAGQPHDNIRTVEVEHGGVKFELSDGAVVIAAITSCTNTSNPDVMISAGLLAKKAIEKGLQVKPWVKTSLAPGSKVVTDYLEESGLLGELEKLNFHVVGYGCTSCIGNSGPLPDAIARAVDEHEMIVAATLSSNRNFEARIHPQVKLNFLMSPPLVVAHALAGRIDIDMLNEPLGTDREGAPVFLKDLWPAEEEISEIVGKVLKKEHFRKNYGEIFDGNEEWQKLEAPSGKDYKWDEKSTYVREAPFFIDLPFEPRPVRPVNGARALLVLGDSITTDHISPAGTIAEDSPAGRYLLSKGVEKIDFNSYGSRRGNDEVMVRGTFANVRIKNKLSSREGGYTTFLPGDEEMSVFDAAMKYKENDTPLLVLAGKEYGSGSSRDWAAKGTSLLGIRAVIAESYERIHRSNLIGMGVLPLQFKAGDSYGSLGLDGTEIFDIVGLDDDIAPAASLLLKVRKDDGSEREIEVDCRLDSQIELEYYRNGGILHYTLRKYLDA